MDQQGADGRFPRRAGGGLELPHWRLPGVREVAEGSQGSGAVGRGHRALPARGGRAQRDDPHHGGDRRGDRGTWRVADTVGP